MKKSSVYSEDEWKELEKSITDIKKWQKTGKQGSLIVSRRNTLSKKFTPKKIVAVRRRQRLTQEDFAVLLNASVDTIRSWEQNKSHPRGPALKLLALFEKYPAIFLAK